APTNRLDFMIRDTAAPLVITRSTLQHVLPESSGWTTVQIDTDWDTIATTPTDQPLEEWATRESLAYILYTSGSTGTPKGVMIAHQAVSLFAEAYRRTFDLGPQDRLLQQAALSFDMSQGEMWTGFLVGATVVAVAPEEGESPEALAALIREQRLSFIGLSPAMLSLVEPGPYPDLKYVMAGGEALPAEVVNTWNLPGRTFANLYGPTETAIACTEYRLEHTHWSSAPPIGRPQVNRQVYVVDQWQNLVPRGVPGELLIGGDPAGLAEGYLNQPELSAEKFIADPFDPDRTVYRSGDLVRWNADGQIEYLGRIDNQVKLRGLRIELGEIEAALRSHPGVRTAVVVMRPDARGENRLVGYLTSEDTEPTVDELRRRLTELLPEYMVPTAYVVLDELPIRAGWKIDYRALPDPVDAGSAAAEYVAPRTPTEEGVAGIYADVLTLGQVGAEDSFFAIGGNSLQAMRVVSQLRKKFGVKVNIRLLYGNAAVSALAAAIDEKLAAAAGR
ncbi:non-ribosomal peptide synthetase, partial [Streptacidiphilus sp. EB129]|uniref:non-ribosomal peptide synthetase n=1 Tax=Streptacidiphilus sp. EB129 TaxID=3156262 RepID=UPI003515EF77